jgi:alpha-L-fucosidase 2
MNWADKTLKTVTVLAKKSGKATLVSGGKRKEITLKKGQKITLEW